MSDAAGDPSATPRFVHWFVTGRVQGVGFRYHVQRAALQCGVRGEVRNTRDGRVEIRAEGSRPQLDRLLQAVRGGPSRARVDGVEVVEDRQADPARNFPRFEIRQ